MWADTLHTLKSATGVNAVQTIQILNLYVYLTRSTSYILFDDGPDAVYMSVLDPCSALSGLGIIRL